jgi:dephospho-CoA kinase
VPARSLVFAVLGGIASGKSEVARLLAGTDGLVLDADRLAAAELGSPAGRERLVERYGAGILGPDGAPDRQAVAARVFSDPAERRWLEGWIHPAVRVRMARELSEARARGVPRIVLDVPLLLENDAEHGLVAACDALVFVEASAEVRARRAAQARGWPPGELARREAAQLPLRDKRARAHHVVRNQGDLRALADEVRRVLAAHGLA